jgi:hypothetical protein
MSLEVFDPVDKELGVSIRRNVRRVIEIKETKVQTTFEDYVFTFRGGFKNLSWRNSIAVLVEETRHLKDAMIVFASAAYVREFFEIPKEKDVEDELLLRLKVMRSSARTVGSRPPSHDFLYEKDNCFRELANRQFKDTKIKPPPSWPVDLPALETFVKAMYNDCPAVSVEQLKIPTDGSKPYEIVFEGIIEDFSQSLLEEAFFGHEEILKDVICEIGMSEESRRVTAIMCGTKVNPLPERKSFRI